MLIVCGARVTWALVFPGIVIYFVVMKSIAEVEVKLDAVSLWRAINVGIGEGVVKGVADVKLSRKADTRVRALSNIVGDFGPGGTM